MEVRGKLSGGGNGKRKLGVGERERSEGGECKENWKKARTGIEVCECMDLSEGLEPTLEGAPRCS